MYRRGKPADASLAGAAGDGDGDSREVKACRGGDLARWQGYEPGKMPHCIMVWGRCPPDGAGLMIREAS